MLFKELINPNNFRFDIDGKEGFEKRIKKGHIREAIVIERFKETFKQQFGFYPKIERCGVDHTGRFVKSATSKADVKINGVLFEIKTQYHYEETFKLKTSNLVSYLRQNAYLLLVNGFELEFPVYTIISPKGIRQILKTAPRSIDYGFKEVCLIDCRKLNWFTLAKANCAELYGQLKQVV